jgi:hypothetical protein
LKSELARNYSQQTDREFGPRALLVQTPITANSFQAGMLLNRSGARTVTAEMKRGSPVWLPVMKIVATKSVERSENTPVSCEGVEIDLARWQSGTRSTSRSEIRRRNRYGGRASSYAG